MFWFLSSQEATKTAEHAGQEASKSAHHVPILVEKINHLIGGPVHEFQVHYTKPLWDKFFAKFGTSAEAVFGQYTPENAVPVPTIMFVTACILCIVIVMLMRRRLSEDNPSGPQQVLEVGILAVRNMLVDVVGPHGVKYFPVVGTFAVLILVSNLMGLFPTFIAPTAATSVTFALGLCSFLYYNYIGIRENGIISHLAHLAGPIWWIGPLIFVIELIGNLVRPMSLGLRLFGNMFADESVAMNIAALFPPYTYWVVPSALMPLGLFVCFIQTFVFTLLSMVYLSEVSHPPHDHGEHGHEELVHA